MLHLETLPKGDYLRDTAMHPDPERPHVYRAQVEPAWTYYFVQGGVSAALALRAAERALGRDDLVALSAHATFCTPIAAGPIEITTRVLRSGKVAAQVSAEISVPGKAGVALMLVATFGQARADSPFSFSQRAFPADVAMPEDLASAVVPKSFYETYGIMPIWNQFDVKVAVGHPEWESGWNAGPGRSAGWLRLRTPATDSDGKLDITTYPFFGDALAFALTQALGPTLAMQCMSPTLSLDVQFLATTTSEWLLVDSRVHEALDGFAHGTVELWDQERKLIALVSQRAALTVWNGVLP